MAANAEGGVVELGEREGSRAKDGEGRGRKIGADCSRK